MGQNYLVSKVRQRAKKQRDSKVKKKPIEYLSDSLIYMLSSFCDPSIPPRKNHEISEWSKKLLYQYSGDTSLFEVGCYQYFSLDYWHYQNNIRKDSQSVLGFCTNEFLTTFEKVLQIDNIDDIYNNRINLYGKIIRESEDEIDEMHHYLTQLLIRSKNNTLPVLYDFTNFPMIIIGAFEVMFLNVAINAKEVSGIPACIKNMQKFYDMIDTSN